MHQSLASIFDAERASLEQKLESLILPNDAERIQQILRAGLMDLVAPKGKFRLSLTMAEDSILQEAIALLNTQFQLLSKVEAAGQHQKQMKLSQQPTTANSTSTSTDSIPIVGSTIGGAAGAWFGPWTAVIGAIAGTAAATYYRELMPTATVRKDISNPCMTKAEPTSEPISLSALINIIRMVCEQIDHLMASYRRQIADLKSSYENREKVTLSSNFQFLLESIQSVIGASYLVNTEKSISRLKDRCEQLSESLENYGLKAVEYTADCPTNYFEITGNDTLDAPITKIPAILEGDRVILKGKAVIPNK